MQNIRNFNLLSLLPPNLQSDTNITAICAAIQPQIQASSNAIDNIMIIAKINQQSSEVIDNLAWQWSTDFYDDSLSLATRKALVQNSLKWHMIKGTPAAVQKMVSTVLSDGVVTEWFQYGGEAYHFRVQTDEIISSEDIFNRLSAVITATQNIRSWLDCVLILRNWSGTDYIGGIICEGKTLTIGPVQFQSVGASGEAYTGGIIYEYKNYTVFGALPSVSAAFCIMPILL